MKQVFIAAMNQPFNLSTMLERIDKHHICGNLTDEDREELVAMAREKADPFGGVDVLKKLEEMEGRLRALEESKQESGTDETGSAPEYTAGKWYYRGDKVTYKGEEYICIAAKGAVCTWSPEDYPPYWEKV